MSTNHATLSNQALAMITWRQAVTLIAIPFWVSIGLTIYANTSIQTFVLIVWLDVWLFACPHVVATYTRIAYNRSSLKQHIGLLTILPALVLLACLLLVSRWGIGGLLTFYYVTQGFHYTRQSYGIARIFQRAQRGDYHADRLGEWLIYGVPLWGLLYRCAQENSAFFMAPLYLPIISMSWVYGIGAIVTGLFLVWLCRECPRWWRARHTISGNAYPIFVLSHLCITLIGYWVFEEITVGWLVINLWHNAQYLIFVWQKNHQGFVLTPPITSDWMYCLCQFRALPVYAALSVITGAIYYQSLTWAGTCLLWVGLPMALVFHFTVNFHHYIVDGIIWRRPKTVRKAGSSPS